MNKFNKINLVFKIYRQNRLQLAIPKLMRGLGTSVKKCPNSFSYPEPYLRAVRRGALAKSKTGNHKNMVKDIYVIRTITFVVANQMPV